MKATRQRHKLPRVDMAPFVSIAMLLITFFIWIKQVERDQVVSIYTSHNGKAEYYQPVTASLFLLDDDRVGYLQFRTNGTADYVETNGSASALRSLVRSMAAWTKPTLVIKPTDHCRIKNLVNVIDALLLDGRITYVMGYQLAEEEQHLLTSYRRYRQVDANRPTILNVPLRQSHL
jgi:biopolymer transport protein ExbD